jgi:tryptophanyl-tRNA synthetase
MKNVLSVFSPPAIYTSETDFGAVQNWVRLQDEYNCTYGVVDYHSMTMPYNAAHTPRKHLENGVLSARLRHQT